jgi:DNA polymerase III alpha subunit
MRNASDEGISLLRPLQYIREFRRAVENIDLANRMIEEAQERNLQKITICGVVKKTTHRRTKEDKPFLIATVFDRTNQIDFMAFDEDHMQIFTNADKSKMPILVEVEIRFKQGSPLPTPSVRKIESMPELAAQLGPPVFVQLKDGALAEDFLKRISPKIIQMNKQTSFDSVARGIVIVREIDIDCNKIENYTLDNICVGNRAVPANRKTILDAFAKDEGVDRVVTEGKEHVPTAA